MEHVQWNRSIFSSLSGHGPWGYACLTMGACSGLCLGAAGFAGQESSWGIILARALRLGWIRKWCPYIHGPHIPWRTLGSGKAEFLGKVWIWLFWQGDWESLWWGAGGFSCPGDLSYILLLSLLNRHSNLSMNAACQASLQPENLSVHSIEIQHC